MTKPFKLAVFIGRFQPFHYAHRECILEALKQAEYVLVLIGSSNVARSARNPFSYDERRVMIYRALGDKVSREDYHRVACAPLPDYPYHFDRWQESVQNAISFYMGDEPHESKHIAIVGHKKGADSFWLDTFPQYSRIDVSSFEGRNATDVRATYFEADDEIPVQHLKLGVPSACMDFLEQFRKESDFESLRNEHHAIKAYRKSWADSPFPPVFMTVDPVVIQSGHVLMVERNEEHGRGLLALPGGFVEQDELLIDAAIRELYEETGLDLPPNLLRGSIKATHVFDDPQRSMRGRTFTYGVLFRLRDDKALFPLKGPKDKREIQEAVWVPLSQLDPTQIFEDHYHIIDKMRGLEV